MRIGGASMVDAEGVMVHGDEEINDFSAALVEDNATALPQIVPTVISPPSDGADHDSFALGFGMQIDRFIDANTGLPLDEGLRRAARKKDIDYCKSKGVWDMRRVNAARARMGR